MLPTMSARVPARLGLFVASLAVALIGAELLLRVTAPDDGGGDDFTFEPTALSLVTEQGRFRRHPVRVFELAPGWSFAPDHLGRYALGDWPFRGPPPEPAPEDLLRVIVVGDSCIYGVAVDAAHTIPARLSDALDARGLGPDRVRVLALGVPGYSTIQQRTLLEEALGQLSPDAIVLYPAAWNDQAPNLWKDDLTLYRARVNPSLLDRAKASSRLVSTLAGRVPRPDPDVLIEAWGRGEPILGTRLSESALDTSLVALIGRAATAGVPAVVVVPGHPPGTVADHPRTVADRDRVRRIARQFGVPLVDTPALLDAAPGPPERYFADFVHPSPEGATLIADATADTLAPLLAAAHPATTRAPPPLAIAGVAPGMASTLGDARLTVSLDGWRSSDPLPTVLVGHAPLLDLRAEGDGLLTGLLVANAAGAQDIVVSTNAAVAVARDALLRVEPALSIIGGQAPALRFTSRPGDRCTVFISPTRAAAPSWSNRGACWLGGEDWIELPVTLIASADGRAEEPVPPALLGDGPPVYVQGIALPPGDPDALAHAARWTPLLVVRGAH